MRAPGADAQEWVTTTARSGLRIERPCWASPFARRLTRRLALAAPAVVADVDALVHDGPRQQWCSIHVADAVAVVTDTDVRPPHSEPAAAPRFGVDFAAGMEDVGAGTSAEVRRALTATLGCPTQLDWVAELDDFWRQHGKDPGMPSSLDVRDHQGARHVVGLGDGAFEIHADGSTLGRVFSGDLLFDEALFGHLLRIVGGLADVSALIGATMREAYGGFEN